MLYAKKERGIPQNQKESEEFWRSHIEKRRISGLSKSAYAKKHDLTYARFTYWCRKEETNKTKLIPVSLKEISSTTELCSLKIGKTEIKIYKLSALDHVLSRLEEK